MLRVLTIILFFFPFSSADSYAEPLLNVEQVIEEKSVLTGKEIKGKLILKNNGDELLKILGVSSTCTLLSGGTLKCWGYGNYGQLGYSKVHGNSNQNTPVSVESFFPD